MSVHCGFCSTSTQQGSGSSVQPSSVVAAAALQSTCTAAVAHAGSAQLLGAQLGLLFLLTPSHTAAHGGTDAAKQTHHHQSLCLAPFARHIGVI